MAKVLVVESDSVFAAVLEDRLHVAGHEVRQLGDAARAAAVAGDLLVDLVVLGFPGETGLAALRELRDQPATRTVAVLALVEPADRVTALKIGADEALSWPCDLEELLLRLERLLASRTATLQVLQGDLVNHPLWAVLQYLRQVRKSGHLRVRGGNGAGTIELRAGELVGARWLSLTGEEALLALLCIEEGGFRFDGEETDEAAGTLEATPLPDLSMHELLLRAAWLKDEIARHRESVPATGQPLMVQTQTIPEAEDEFATLPFQRIVTRVLQKPGTRLFDLLADEAEAPLTTRLAVAWLVEQGVLAPEGAGRVQNTVEISSSLLFEVALADLVEAAAAAGLSTTALPYLLLVEPAVWPALRRLIEGAPGFRQNEALQRLVEQVELRRAGSATFTAGPGKLSLHVQVLSGAAQPQISAIVPGCAGVLLWLQGTEALETARGVVQRLEASGLKGATGVVVASGKAADGLLQAAKKASRWRTSEHEPQSLLGVLRLLHPPESR